MFLSNICRPPSWLQFRLRPCSAVVPTSHKLSLQWCRPKTNHRNFSHFPPRSSLWISSRDARACLPGSLHAGSCPQCCCCALWVKSPGVTSAPAARWPLRPDVVDALRGCCRWPDLPHQKRQGEKRCVTHLIIDVM